jgi:signal transduction histidine kinase
VRWALYHEIDQLLQEDLQEVSLAVSAAEPNEFPLLKEELERKALGHRQHGWFVELFDARLLSIWASQDAPFELSSFAPADHQRPYTLQGLRIIEQRVKRGVGEISGVRVGAKLESLDRDMDHVDRLMLIASGTLMVIAPLCGYWLAGRAAQTVGDIIHTATRLRPSRLDERLRLRGTGDELDELSLTINRLLDRIAAYLQQKRDFLANAAHELRTPLAAIRSSIEVALNAEGARVDYDALLEDLIDQSSSLETLVNQLLLLSETETDQWKHRSEHVAFHEVVSRAVEMFQGVAEFRNIRLRLGAVCQADLSGSRQHLRQVVNNLIDNAVKYTPAGGEVCVQLESCEEGRCVRLTISDTGIGIAPEDVPRVFDRFFRADRSRSRTLSATGTGLGLSICQAVVMAHGGTIHCRSALHEGTTLEVVLPVLAPGGADADAAYSDLQLA